MCCRRSRPRRRRGRARPPRRATRPCHAGCDRALWCGAKARCSCWSTMFSEPGLCIELPDQLIPDRGGLPQLSPKALAASPFEVVERHALLLDPGVVAEIEYSRALAMGQFENVVVGGGEQVLAES